MKKVTVRQIIELLAKCNWDAEIKISIEQEFSPCHLKSVSEYRRNGRKIVELVGTTN